MYSIYVKFNSVSIFTYLLYHYVQSIYTFPFYFCKKEMLKIYPFTVLEIYSLYSKAST